MGSQIKLTVSLVMIALFSIAIIGFAINFATDNDAYMSVADSNLNTLDSKTRTNLSTFKDQSGDTYDSIVSTTVEPGSDVIRSASSFTITWGNVFGVTSNIMTVGYENIFGKGESFGIFLSAFIGIIGFIFALYLIKTWRGNP